MSDEPLNLNDVFDRFSVRWPKLGDRLLSPSRNVYLAEAGDERNYRLLRGYKRAGDILTESALSDRLDLPNLIFPALFNYRHYIELALKAIIEEHGAYVDVRPEKKSHKLPELWLLFLKIAAAFGNDKSNEDVVAVGNCIAEIDHIDSGSTTFRYARDLRGDVPQLPKDGLDLVGLRDVMNGIENFFEAVDASFNSLTESAAEQACERDS